MARWLIVAGMALLVLGIAMQYAPWLLGWFGKLPGDLDLRTGRTRVFIPITSMLLVSLVLTVILNLLRR